MAGQAGLLELSVGSVLRLDGTEWTVAAIEAQYGRVLLGAGEEEKWRSTGGWRTTATARAFRQRPGKRHARPGNRRAWMT